MRSQVIYMMDGDEGGGFSESNIDLLGCYLFTYTTAEEQGIIDGRKSFNKRAEAIKALGRIRSNQFSRADLDAIGALMEKLRERAEREVQTLEEEGRRVSVEGSLTRNAYNHLIEARLRQITDAENAFKFMKDTFRAALRSMSSRDLVVVA